MILVFDLGGGTFDVSILSINQKEISVIATYGNNHLGGIDFDNKIVELFVKRFEKLKKKHKFKDELKIIEKFKRESEEIKIHLSNMIEASISITDDIEIKITRADFEFMCEDLFQECINSIDKVIIMANIKKEQIKNIIKIGGSSRIPKINQLLEEYFNKDILNKAINVNPDEAVAIGAAYQAASIKGCFDNILEEKKILIDIVGINIGIDDNGKMDIIFKYNMIIPNKQIKILTIENNQSELNIKVFQGENYYNNENFLIQDFVIDNVKKNDVFDIIFEISVDSILSVSYQKKGSDEIIKLGEKVILTKKKINQIKEIIKNEKNKKGKVELLKSCLEEYEKNKKNANINYILNWIEINPNESDEIYLEKKNELYEKDLFIELNDFEL